jgi:uncharacterized protein
MNNLFFTLIVGFASIAGGLLGSMTGLGGGVVVIPLLTLVFGVDIHYAIGASLISIIATSSGSASVYVREGYTNLRVGMFLETATTIGAIIGATLTTFLPGRMIEVVFGFVLLYSAYASYRPPEEKNDDDQPDPLSERLGMNGSYPAAEGEKHYHVHNVPGGFGMMFAAGGLSGLLGIGSGALKVLAMDRIMRMPFKVSTTTSNFMIGVTAAASAGIYIRNGYIEPGIAMPVMLGVFAGSMIGARVLTKTRSTNLRMIFAAVILVVGIYMIYKGFKGSL